MCVPELPGVLLADQQHALALEQKAVALAEMQGVRVVGLGNALGVVAQRGNGLAERVQTPVTNGQAATAWTATEITMEVLRRRGKNREPVGVLGMKSAVGDAICSRLTANGVPVVVAEQGRTATRA